MNIRFDIILYLGVLFTLSFLIFRYARYSRWEDTDAGRAFMGMKVCLLALVVFALAARFDRDGAWIPVARWFVVGGIWLALTYQVRVMVRRQGGLRRNRPVERWVPYHTDPLRYDRRKNDKLT